MKMQPWLAEVAKYEYGFTADTPISYMKEKINELAAINGVDKQFYPQEIGVSKIFESCRDDIERSRLVAWQKYESVYHDLHFKYKMGHEKLSTYEENSVIIVMKALNTIGLTSILTDGLDARTLKYVQELMQ